MSVILCTIVLSDMCCFPLFLNFFSYSVFGGIGKVSQAHSRVCRLGLKLINLLSLYNINHHKLQILFDMKFQTLLQRIPPSSWTGGIRAGYYSVRWIKQTRNYRDLNGNMLLAVEQNQILCLSMNSMMSWFTLSGICSCTKWLPSGIYVISRSGTAFFTAPLRI